MKVLFFVYPAIFIVCGAMLGKMIFVGAGIRAFDENRFGFNSDDFVIRPRWPFALSILCLFPAVMDSPSLLWRLPWLISCIFWLVVSFYALVKYRPAEENLEEPEYEVEEGYPQIFK